MELWIRILDDTKMSLKICKKLTRDPLAFSAQEFVNWRNVCYPREAAVQGLRFVECHCFRRFLGIEKGLGAVSKISS